MALRSCRGRPTTSGTPTQGPVPGPKAVRRTEGVRDGIRAQVVRTDGSEDEVVVVRTVPLVAVAGRVAVGVRGFAALVARGRAVVVMKPGHTGVRAVGHHEGP